MGDVAGRVAVTTENKMQPSHKTIQSRQSFEGLRRKVDRLFDDFDRVLWSAPFRRSIFDVESFWSRTVNWTAEPAVDIVEKEKVYEIAAELPGMDAKDIEIKQLNGSLVIKGEKRQEKEEKQKDYYLHERSFGTFERCFAIPEGIDVKRIEAQFKMAFSL